MKDARQKRPHFSKKGNPDDYNYMAYEVKFLMSAVAFILVVIWIVESGLYDTVRGWFY